MLKQTKMLIFVHFNQFEKLLRWVRLTSAIHLLRISIKRKRQGIINNKLESVISQLIYTYRPLRFLDLFKVSVERSLACLEISVFSITSEREDPSQSALRVLGQA